MAESTAEKALEFLDRAPRSLLTWVVGVLYAASSAVFGAGPIGQGLEIAAWSTFGGRQLQPAEVTRLRQLQRLPEADALAELAQWGYDEPEARALLQLAQQPLPPAEVLELHRRGELGDQDSKEADERALKALRRSGLSDEDAALVLELRRVLPGLSDVVRFAVREAFDPEAVDRLGLLRDLPPVYLSEARKRGLSKEDAERFWAAHWEQVSNTAAGEMFHRLAPDVTAHFADELRSLGVEPAQVTTTLEDVRNLYKVNDVAHFWRDRLTALNRTPFTRVDLRRLYAAGLIDESDVFFGYRELGYSKERAEKLTEFALYDATSTERTAVKGSVVRQIVAGMMTADEGRDLLMAARWPERVARVIVGAAVLRREEEEHEDLIEGLVDQYRVGLLTRDELARELEKATPSETERSKILRREDRRLTKARKLPALSDVSRWFKAGILTEVQYRNRLQQMGYHAEDVDKYVKSPPGQG